jgi:hypothetical protein
MLSALIHLDGLREQDKSKPVRLRQDRKERSPESDIPQDYERIQADFRGVRSLSTGVASRTAATLLKGVAASGRIETGRCHLIRPPVTLSRRHRERGNTTPHHGPGSSPRRDTDGDIFGAASGPALLAEATPGVALVVCTGGSWRDAHCGVLGAGGIRAWRGIVHTLVAAWGQLS